MSSLVFPQQKGCWLHQYLSSNQRPIQNFCYHTPRSDSKFIGWEFTDIGSALRCISTGTVMREPTEKRNLPMWTRLSICACKCHESECGRWQQALAWGRAGRGECHHNTKPIFHDKQAGKMKSHMCSTQLKRMHDVIRAISITKIRRSLLLRCPPPPPNPTLPTLFRHITYLTGWPSKCGLDCHSDKGRRFPPLGSPCSTW